VPPIALVDWEDGETLVAVADGAGGLVRPEPPVPVEQLIFRGVSAGVKLGGDGVIMWEPRPCQDRAVSNHDRQLRGCDRVQPPFPRHSLQFHQATVFEADPGPDDQVLDCL
jgi:hypothetical protein